MPGTRNNSRARPGRTCSPPRRSAPAAALTAGLDKRSGRALGTLARGGPPARPGCPAGPFGILLSVQGQRRERGVATAQAAAARPPHRSQELQGGKRGRRSFPPRGPGFSAPGEADSRKAWFLPAFLLWCRWPQNLGPDFQPQGPLTAPAAAPWLSRNPGPSACCALFYSLGCIVSKTSKGTRQTAGIKICRYSSLLCLLISVLWPLQLPGLKFQSSGYFLYPRSPLQHPMT